MSPFSMKFNFSNPYLDAYLDLVEGCAVEPGLDTESHHIYPKSIFGHNEILVELSYADHFRAHWLIMKAYEFEGDTRKFMQMSKALFMFTGHNASRARMIESLTIEEMEELVPLVEDARRYNRITSTGEMNPFYGHKHSPETLQKIMDTREANPWTHTEESYGKIRAYFDNRNPDAVKKLFYHNVKEAKTIRLSNNEVNEGKIPEGYVPGRFMTDDSRFLHGLAIREALSELDFSWVKRGKDNYFYQRRHVHNQKRK